MDGQGGKVSSDFVDALFDDNETGGQTQVRNPPVVPRNMANMGQHGMHGVPQMHMGAVGAPVHNTGLATFAAGTLPSTRPMGMPAYASGTAQRPPQRMEGAQGPISAAQVRGVPGPAGGIIPPNLLPSSVPATGFATNPIATTTSNVHGGLSALGAKMSPNPQPPTISGKPSVMPAVSRPTGASPVTIIPSNAQHMMRATTAPGHHSTASQTLNSASEISRTSVAPSTAQYAPQTSTNPRPAPIAQPVSAKSSAASMNKAVVSTSTSAPAPKKQMLSGDGASRARNADGSISSYSGHGAAGGNGDDDGDGEERDDLITRQDAEEVALDPIIHGKSKLTEDDMRRERAKDENRKIVNVRVVKAKCDAICISEHMRVAPKVAEAISLGLQRRLEDAMSLMVEFSRRRMDLEGDISSSSIVRSSNPRLYLKEEERKKQEEREKRIAARLAAESGVSVLDPSALRRQEEETAATVLDMAGGARPRRTGLAAMTAAMDVSHQHGNLAPISAATASAATSQTQQSQAFSIKERSRKVTLHDALTFLRQDAHVKHSTLTLNTLAGLKPGEASSISISQYNAAGASMAASAGATYGNTSSTAHHQTVMTRAAAAASSSSAAAAATSAAASSHASGAVPQVSNPTTTTAAAARYQTSSPHVASSTSAAPLSSPASGITVSAMGVPSNKVGPSPRPMTSPAASSPSGLMSLQGTTSSPSLLPQTAVPTATTTRVTRSSVPTQKK